MVAEDFLWRLNEQFRERQQSEMPECIRNMPLKFEQGGYDIAVLKVPRFFAMKCGDAVMKAINAIDDSRIEERVCVNPYVCLPDTKTPCAYAVYAVKANESVVVESVYDEGTLNDMMAESSGSKYEGAVGDGTYGILPVPAPKKGASDCLYLTLRYEPYDLIKSGAKHTEFREYSPFWVRRILSNPPKTVKFQRGYAKGAEQMVWTVKGVELYNMHQRKSSYPWVYDKQGLFPTHIAIDLGERIDKE